MNTTMPLSPPDPLWRRAQRGLRDTSAVTIARAWLDSSAWGLLMLGGVGRGKSQAAAWLWIKLRTEDITAASAPGVFAPTKGVVWLRARALQRLGWDERSEVLRGCASAYGLVVDEMGAEDGRTAQAIGDLVEERGDRQSRTVMTTNLGAQGFLDRYGDRLTSRLRSGGIDNGRARWARVVAGDDLRGVAPEKPLPVPDVGPPVTPERQEEIISELTDGPGPGNLITMAGNTTRAKPC